MAVLNKLRSLGGDTLIYGIANAVTRSISLITFPILARSFSPSDYGQIDTLLTLTVLLTSLLLIGQDSAIARFYHEKNSEQQRKFLVSESLFLQLGSCMLALLFAFFFQSNIVPIYLSSSTIFVCIILQIPFQVLISNCTAILQVSFEKGKYILLSLGQTLTTVGFLAVVISLNATIENVFKGYLVVSVIFAIIGLFLIRSYLIIPVSFKLLSPLLNYGVPMGLIVFLGSLQPYLERAFVLNLLTGTDLGTYAAAAKVSLLVALPISALQAAWSPFMLYNYKSPDAANMFNWVLKLLVIVLAITIMFISTFSSEMVRLLAGEKYSSGHSLVFPLAMGLVFQAVGLITGIGTVLNKKTHYRLYLYIISLLVTSVLSYFLIQHVGLNGLPYAVLSGQIVKCVLETIVSVRFFKIDWNYIQVATILMFTIVFGVFMSSVQFDLLTRLCALMSASAVLLIFVWYFVLNCNERNRASSMISGLVKSYS